ncbi:transcription initiation factor TFIIIB [Bacillus taeanensis]|uniref:Transcription initiation factor TFIIIB n=1 Tax=Bacillus taeanensis TaxID=273032 RepID=A0A366XS24_9BACI|nr:transcription initiation factor TFIIIB [Bacillus taeanensis]RBW68348.1 transcription initiation factor TFIIIB [Bacillus taeanensis]
MNGSTKVTECPKCGGKELGKGKHSGYAVMVPVNKVMSFGSDVEYIICTECGFIIESYVKKPEKFNEIQPEVPFLKNSMEF